MLWGQNLEHGKQGSLCAGAGGRDWKHCLGLFPHFPKWWFTDTGAALHTGKGNLGQKHKRMWCLGYFSEKYCLFLSFSFPSSLSPCFPFSLLSFISPPLFFSFFLMLEYLFFNTSTRMNYICPVEKKPFLSNLDSISLWSEYFPLSNLPEPQSFWFAAGNVQQLSEKNVALVCFPLPAWPTGKAGLQDGPGKEAILPHCIVWRPGLALASLVLALLWALVLQPQ